MKLKLTALAVLLAASTMHAALVDYQAGDLVLSVYAKGGVGSTVNVSVGLGDLATAFRDGALGGSSYWTSAGSDSWSFNTNLGATLDEQFGDNWQSRTDLYWGISGVLTNSNFAGTVNGDPRQTVYVSHAAGAIPTSLVGSQVVTASTAMVGFQNSLAGRNADPGQTLVVTYGDQDINSYESYMADVTKDRFADWQFFTSGANLSGALTVERYLSLTGGSSAIGNFSFDSSGNLTFQAVPEPSTVGLLAVTALSVGVFVWKRRRATVSVA